MGLDYGLYCRECLTHVDLDRFSGLEPALDLALFLKKHVGHSLVVLSDGDTNPPSIPMRARLIVDSDYEGMTYELAPVNEFGVFCDMGD